MADVAALVIQVTSEGAQRAIQDLKDVAAAGKVTEDQTTSLVDSLKNLASAWVIKEAAEALLNIAQMGARYEMLGATMGVMANNVGMYRSDLDQLQISMEKTGITSMEARKGLQIMAAAQVDMSKASDLARVAQDAATIAGINSSQAFDNLVRGIATGESRIIRHMGIMVNYKNSVKEWADAHGIAVSAMTSVQLAQARLDSTLDEGRKRAGVYEEAMTTAGKQILSMQRYTDNLKVAIGEVFNPSTNELIFALVAAMKDASEAMKTWEDSGGKAVFMEKLRSGMETLIGVIKSVTSFLWDHKTALEVVAMAWGSLKFAEYVKGFVNAAAAMYGASLQGQAIYMNEARGNLMVAQSILAKNEARQLELALERAKHMNWFRSNAAIAEEIALNVENAAAINAVAVAQERLTVAASGGAKAVSMFSAAVTAMGGPITILVGLLAMAAAAWYMFANKEKKAQKDNDAALEEEIDRIKRETKRKNDVLDLLKNGRTEEADKLSHDYQPIIRMQEREIENIRAKKLSEEEYQALKTRTRGYDMSLNQGYRELGGDVKKLREQNELIEREAYLQGRVTKAKEDTMAMDKLDIEIQQERQRLAKLGEKEPKDEKKLHELQYARELAEWQRKKADADDKALFVGKEQTKILLIENELNKALAVNDAQRKEKGADIAKLNGIRDAINAYGVSAKALATLTAEEERRAKAQKESERITNKITDSIQALTDKNWEFGKSEEQIAVYRLLGIQGTYALNEAQKALRDTYIDQLKLQTANLATAELIRNGKQKNKVKMEESDALFQLNMEASLVKMLPGVYEKAWIEIMMKGDSATALIVQGTRSMFGNLENAFVTFVTTGKASFKSLMASIAADLAKLYASKAFQQLFLMMAPSGGAGWSPSALGSMGTNSTDLGIGWGGAFAAGGSIPGGKMSLVGERGPELFIPGQSGTIVPNNALGSQVTTYITVNVQDGQATTSGNQKGNSIGVELEGIMDNWAMKNSRPGGLFNQLRSA